MNEVSWSVAWFEAARFLPFRWLDFVVTYNSWISLIFLHLAFINPRSNYACLRACRGTGGVWQN